MNVAEPVVVGPRKDPAMKLDDWKGRVDFGIITIREDEFKAVLQRFPERLGKLRGPSKTYNLRSLALPNGELYVVAVVRCAAQGNAEAQQVANALLTDLEPRWLLVVGIAGGKPTSEFSLGDVVVSTQICDFRLGASTSGSHEYGLNGVPCHPDALNCVANLPAIEDELGDWSSDVAIGLPRPEVQLSAKRLYGSQTWRKDVMKSLEAHFTQKRQPLVTAGAIACSDLVIKDAELLRVWLQIARQVVAVEMESAGVHRAAFERHAPFLSIRGISDIVGFRRESEWIDYACHSAASFLLAFLRTRPISVQAPPEPNSQHVLRSLVDYKSESRALSWIKQKGINEAKAEVWLVGATMHHTLHSESLVHRLANGLKVYVLIADPEGDEFPATARSFGQGETTLEEEARTTLAGCLALLKRGERYRRALSVRLVNAVFTAGAYFFDPRDEAGRMVLVPHMPKQDAPEVPGFVFTRSPGGPLDTYFGILGCKLWEEGVPIESWMEKHPTYFEAPIK